MKLIDIKYDKYGCEYHVKPFKDRETVKVINVGRFHNCENFPIKHRSELKNNYMPYRRHNFCGFSDMCQGYFDLVLSPAFLVDDDKVETLKKHLKHEFLEILIDSKITPGKTIVKMIKEERHISNYNPKRLMERIDPKGVLTLEEGEYYAFIPVEMFTHIVFKDILKMSVKSKNMNIMKIKRPKYGKKYRKKTKGWIDNKEISSIYSFYGDWIKEILKILNYDVEPLEGVRHGVLITE